MNFYESLNNDKDYFSSPEKHLRKLRKKKREIEKLKKRPIEELNAED